MRGRADGYDPARNRLEEIKTFRGDLERQPANHRQLHWAQAKIYGWLLCQTRGLDELELALVYFDVTSHKETLFVERHTAAQLRVFFETQCQAFIDWAAQEMAHRAARDQALSALRFPHDDFRTGQRQLAEAVYKAACTGTTLMAQAPTGIGKTLGTLFPQLKAFPGQRLDKLFFLAAKTSGRRLALDALQTLQRNANHGLRVLELVAREKTCEHPDKACHGESCPSPAASTTACPRRAPRWAALLDQAALREVALAHQVCPYYLSQEVARWADVVVGDYNYYFDSSALLHGLALANDWRICLLVDEAHNLIDRARGMYSAELDQRAFVGLASRRQHPKRPLGRVQRCWNELHREQLADYQCNRSCRSSCWARCNRRSAPSPTIWASNPQGWMRNCNEPISTPCISAVSPSCSVNTRCSTSACCRRLLAARPVVRSFACAMWCPPLSGSPPAQARSSVLFSATLSPRRFHADMLGLPAGSAWIDVESPFESRQLRVCLAEHVSTRYQHRQASLGAVVELIAHQYRERPGNYLAFFSSFDYLQQVAALLRAMPGRTLLGADPRHAGSGAQCLSRSLYRTQRRNRFRRAWRRLRRRYRPARPAPDRCLRRDPWPAAGQPGQRTIQVRLDELFGRGHGYDYTYLYPGLQRSCRPPAE